MSVTRTLEASENSTEAVKERTKPNNPQLKTPTRERWLTRLAQHLDQELFDGRMPKYRVTCGWPSSRGTSAVKRVVGECWSDLNSADQTHEILITIAEDDEMEVAAILAHEMIHAIVGLKAGHKGPFKKLATEIGLEGRMTATTPGEAFKRSVEPILKKIGKYPHARLDASSETSQSKPKQTTRLLKASCDCGYTVRITRKWLDEVGAPHCPAHGEMNVEEK